jgi:hypothetical protein
MWISNAAAPYSLRRFPSSVTSIFISVGTRAHERDLLSAQLDRSTIEYMYSWYLDFLPLYSGLTGHDKSYMNELGAQIHYNNALKYIFD